MAKASALMGLLISSNLRRGEKRVPHFPPSLEGGSVIDANFRGAAACVRGYPLRQEPRGRNSSHERGGADDPTLIASYFFGCILERAVTSRQKFHRSIVWVVAGKSVGNFGVMFKSTGCKMAPRPWA